MKTYQNGPYIVTIGFDGAIKVKPNDWLTKYSAAIHNNFFNVNEYGRKDNNGSIQPITNVDQIFSDETIYHLPTIDTTFIPKLDDTPKLAQDEKKRLIIKTLAHDFNLQGKNLEIFKYVIDHVSELVVHADN